MTRLAVVAICSLSIACTKSGDGSKSSSGSAAPPARAIVHDTVQRLRRAANVEAVPRARSAVRAGNTRHRRKRPDLGQGLHRLRTRARDRDPKDPSRVPAVSCARVSRRASSSSREERDCHTTWSTLTAGRARSSRSASSEGGVWPELVSKRSVLRARTITPVEAGHRCPQRQVPDASHERRRAKVVRGRSGARDPVASERESKTKRGPRGPRCNRCGADYSSVPRIMT